MSKTSEMEHTYEVRIDSKEIMLEYAEKSEQEFMEHVADNYFSTFSQEFKRLIHPERRRGNDQEVLDENWNSWTIYIWSLPEDKQRILAESFCNSQWDAFSTWVAEGIDGEAQW